MILVIGRAMNNPTDRPDVEGIAEAAWDVDAFLAVRKDIPALITYIEALKARQVKLEAVVVVVRQRVKNCHKCENGIIGEYVGLDKADMPELVPHSCPNCSDLRESLAALEEG